MKIVFLLLIMLSSFGCVTNEPTSMTVESASTVLDGAEHGCWSAVADPLSQESSALDPSLPNYNGCTCDGSDLLCCTFDYACQCYRCTRTYSGSCNLCGVPKCPKDPDA